MKILTIRDLSNVLHALNHVPENVHENTMLDEYTNSVVIGEHIIAFWIEADNSIQWYLGVVDGMWTKRNLISIYLSSCTFPQIDVCAEK